MDAMTEWFLDRQHWIMIATGCACVLIVAVLDERWPTVLIGLVIPLALVLTGGKLYDGETSENWVKFSYGEIVKNVLGIALIGIGWIMFLRIVVALAAAVLITRLD